MPLSPQCARVGVETLTLSRFYLESSLLYYNFVTCLESKMAAACLFIAMCINKESSWVSCTACIQHSPQHAFNIHHSMHSTFATACIQHSPQRAFNIHQQDGTLKHYTGYEVKDVSDQVLAINQAVNTTPHHVSTILSKYSHPLVLLCIFVLS